MRLLMNLCSPALLYLVFSVTQVVIDTIKGLYNVALLKFIMMILFTLLLNILCERGLGVISWIIVFIPFLLMSLITTILLFVFGLDPSSGNIIPPRSSYKPSTEPSTEPSPKQTTSTTTQHKNKGHHVSHSSVKEEKKKIASHPQLDFDKEIDNRIDKIKKSLYSDRKELDKYI